LTALALHALEQPRAQNCIELDAVEANRCDVEGAAAHLLVAIVNRLLDTQASFPPRPGKIANTRHALGNRPLTIAFMRFASANANLSASVVVGPASLAPRLTKNGRISSRRMSAGSSPMTLAHVKGPGTSFPRLTAASSARNADLAGEPDPTSHAARPMPPLVIE
jgi:hypothetical protein